MGVNQAMSYLIGGKVDHALIQGKRRVDSTPMEETNISSYTITGYHMI